MSSIAFIFGVLLSVLGIVLYAVADPEHRSFTALIPTLFGIVLIIFGIAARNPKGRMHAMHGAALLTLIGFLFPTYRVIRFLAGGGDWNLATTGQVIMAALCGLFLFLCVKSFIAARRARKQNAGV